MVITNNTKVALRYKENDYALWINGVQEAVDTTGSVPSTIERLKFEDATGGAYFYGKCKDIRVYNTKEMTDSEVDILLTKITS